MHDEQCWHSPENSFGLKSLRRSRPSSFNIVVEGMRGFFTTLLVVLKRPWGVFDRPRSLLTLCLSVRVLRVSPTVVFDEVPYSTTPSTHVVVMALFGVLLVEICLLWFRCGSLEDLELCPFKCRAYLELYPLWDGALLELVYPVDFYFSRRVSYHTPLTFTSGVG